MEEQNIPTENVVSPAIEETPPKKVANKRKKRTALCLNCKNEWMANNGNDKKPTRCPECMSRNVVWRDIENAQIEDIPDGIPEIPSNSNDLPPTPEEEFQDVPPRSKEFHDVPKSSKEFHENSTAFQGVPRRSKKIPLRSKEFQDDMPLEEEWMEGPTTFEEIREEYEKNTPKVPIPLLMIGLGVIVVVVVVFFRRSKIPQKKVQGTPKKEQALPRKPAPSTIEPKGTNFVTLPRYSIGNRNTLIGGIV